MKKTTKQSKHLVLAAAIAVGLSGTLVPRPANASGWPVVDITQIMNALKEYGEQYSRWKTTVSQYQSQLAQLKRMYFAALLQKDGSIKRVDPYDGISEACPGALSLGMVTSLLTSNAVNLDGDIRTQQLKVCALIVKNRNDQFNLAVDLINAMEKKAKEVERLQQQGDSAGKDTGNVQSANNSAQVFAAQTAIDVQHFDAKIKALQQYEKRLFDTQGRLGKRALRGSMMGKIVQTATLAKELGD